MKLYAWEYSSLATFLSMISKQRERERERGRENDWDKGGGRGEEGERRI